MLKLIDTTQLKLVFQHNANSLVILFLLLIHNRNNHFYMIVMHTIIVFTSNFVFLAAVLQYITFRMRRKTNSEIAEQLKTLALDTLLGFWLSCVELVDESVHSFG